MANLRTCRWCSKKFEWKNSSASNSAYCSKSCETKYKNSKKKK